jgi:hypothetical protein
MVLRELIGRKGEVISYRLWGALFSLIKRFQSAALSELVLVLALKMFRLVVVAVAGDRHARVDE